MSSQLTERNHKAHNFKGGEVILRDYGSIYAECQMDADNVEVKFASITINIENYTFARGRYGLRGIIHGASFYSEAQRKIFEIARERQWCARDGKILTGTEAENAVEWNMHSQTLVHCKPTNWRELHAEGRKIEPISMAFGRWVAHHYCEWIKYHTDQAKVIRPSNSGKSVIIEPSVKGCQAEVLKKDYLVNFIDHVV